MPEFVSIVHYVVLVAILSEDRISSDRAGHYHRSDLPHSRRDKVADNGITRQSILGSFCPMKQAKRAEREMRESKETSERTARRSESERLGFSALIKLDRQTDRDCHSLSS